MYKAERPVMTVEFSSVYDVWLLFVNMNVVCVCMCVLFLDRVSFS